ncbi:hypothetical protein RSOL_105420, partial [Rhizoctonia solani AG-3 Rhs1AP]
MRAQVAELEAQRRKQLPVCGSAAHATLARLITFHTTPPTPPFDYPLAYKPNRPRARPGVDRRAGSQRA